MKKPRKLHKFFDRGDIYPWPWTFADEVLTKDIGNLARGKKMSIILEEFIDGHIHHYFDEKEMNELIRCFLNKLVNDRAYLGKVVEKIHSLVKELLSYCEKLPNKNLESISAKRLLFFMSGYEQRLKRARTWGWIPPLIDGLTKPFLSDACIQSLQADLPHLNAGDINKIYSAFSSPDSLGEVQKSEMNKFKLVISLGSNIFNKLLHSKNTDQFIDSIPSAPKTLLNNYIKKYAWVTYNYEGPALTLDLLKSSLKGITVSRAQKELSRINANHKDALKQKKALARKFMISPKTKHLLRIASAFMTLKEYRKSVYQQSYVLLDPIINEAARRIGVQTDEAKFILPREIGSALKKPKAYGKIARQRRKYCIVIIRRGRSHFFQQEQASRLVKKYCASEEIISAKVLNGQVAYPGKVKGIAKIVLTAKDMSKINAGEVLVSSSTNPDLLPAMKKAAAFVTDMGGIISHAAIVSRELRTPCIVGTKFATKVIKDGDMVEVDAEKGIVNIL